MPARRSTNLLWLLAVLTGAALRLYQIRDQVLVDDEWHALHALLAGGPLDVLLSFGASDHSIPLTLYDLLLERTVGLTELGMRLPSLLAGIASLVVLPWLVRDLAGLRASVVFAWLLAIAPLHVFFSRYARPYELAMLLCFVAVVACYRWLAGGGRRWQVAFVGCAIVAPWLLLVTLPVVATPLALAVVAACTGVRATLRARALLVTALVVVGGWTLLLAPPLLANAGAVSDKVARGTVELATLRGASELLLGTPSAPLRLLVLAAALAGAIVLARAQPRFAAWVAIVCAAQLAALLMVRPHGLRFPIVFARYCFALSPFLLLTIALGVDAADRRLAASVRWARGPLVSAVVLVVLAGGGPLGWIYAWPNDFTNHGSFQADYAPGRYFERFRPAVIPDFYGSLAQRPPGSVTIVEAPWHYFWHSLAYTQRIHRQHVVVGFVDPGSGKVRNGEVPRERTGIRLRNALHVGDQAALRARGVDYVILHHDAHAEMRVPFAAPPVRADAWIAAYRESYGAPVHEDAAITVFDVREGE